MSYEKPFTITERWAVAILLGHEPPLNLSMHAQGRPIAIMSDTDGRQLAVLAVPAQSSSEAQPGAGREPMA